MVAEGARQSIAAHHRRQTFILRYILQVTVASLPASEPHHHHHHHPYPFQLDNLKSEVGSLSSFIHLVLMS